MMNETEQFVILIYFFVIINTFFLFIIRIKFYSSK